MALTLDTLKEIFDHHFNPPFIPAGVVEARFVHPAGDEGSRVLEIKIGPRDIWIEENGEVSASGTSFLEQISVVSCLDADLPEVEAILAEPNVEE